MCKHILNAAVSIQAPCCLNWFDCSECHDLFMDHPLVRPKTNILLFACYSCKLSFHKNLVLFGDGDEKCPHCAVTFVMDGVTHESLMFEEVMDDVDGMIGFVTDSKRSFDVDCGIFRVSDKTVDDQEAKDVNEALLLQDGIENDAKKKKEERRKTILAAKKGT